LVLPLQEEDTMFLNTVVSHPFVLHSRGIEETELRDTLRLPAAFRCTVFGFRDWGWGPSARLHGALFAPSLTKRDSRELRMQTPVGRVKRTERKPPASLLYLQPTTKPTLLGESVGVRSLTRHGQDHGVGRAPKAGGPRASLCPTPRSPGQRPTRGLPGPCAHSAWLWPSHQWRPVFHS
jgi:hypothetical protein